MTVLEQLSKLSSAEDFFRFLDVPCDPAVLNVARLHILRRMADNLRNASAQPGEAEAYAYFRRHLQQAYNDFVHSSPIQERVFKVHRDAVSPRSSPLVRITACNSTSSNQDGN